MSKRGEIVSKRINKSVDHEKQDQQTLMSNRMNTTLTPWATGINKNREIVSTWRMNKRGEIIYKRGMRKREMLNKMNISNIYRQKDQDRQRKRYDEQEDDDLEQQEDEQ